MRGEFSMGVRYRRLGCIRLVLFSLLCVAVCGCGRRDRISLVLDGPIGGHLSVAMGGEVRDLEGLEGVFADGQVVRYRVTSTSVRIAGSLRSFVLVGGAGKGVRVRSLDVSDAPGLETLECEGQLLDTLDLSGNASLVSVSLSGNPLRCLDLSNCLQVERLRLSGTGLRSLDVSHRARLRELSVDGSSLEALCVRGCGQLLSLDCSGNRLGTLDLTGVHDLQLLQCGGNVLDTLRLDGLRQLLVLHCAGNGLRGLDLSPTPLLRELVCHENRIDELGMERLVSSLPLVGDRSGRLVPICVGSVREGNASSVMVESLARLKGWEVYEMVFGGSE